MSKKTYVLDTSVFLTDATAITRYGTNDIVIPQKVLEEIDRFKKHQNGVGHNSRKIIRTLDELRSKGSLYEGAKIATRRGKAIVKNYNPSVCPEGMDMSDADNQIICTALTLKETSEDKIVLVSRDINMRVKCDALGLECEDYVVEQVIKDTEELYSGFTSVLVDDVVIDKFYNKESVYLNEDNLLVNQFVMLISNANEKKTALAQFFSFEKPLGHLNDYKNGIFGIYPRNKEQIFTFNLLMNPNIPVVTLSGNSGTGKTLLVLAAALQQVLSDKPLYKKLIVSRPIQPVGNRELGFLPGSALEKQLPWLAPVQDNLEFLLGNDKNQLEMYIEDGTIEVEAITYIRGRSISNAIIYFDEIQNISKAEVKTILTRVGENSKIILTGDISQIDNEFLNDTSNGLTYVIEKLKDQDIAGHVTLTKGERSKVATICSKVL